eukprot:444418-Amphidinium_carterae.1
MDGNAHAALQKKISIKLTPLQWRKIVHFGVPGEDTRGIKALGSRCDIQHGLCGPLGLGNQAMARPAQIKAGNTNTELAKAPTTGMAPKWTTAAPPSNVTHLRPQPCHKRKRHGALQQPESRLSLQQAHSM